jgi:tight adherence protein C
MPPEILSGIAFLAVTGLVAGGYWLSTPRSPVAERLKEILPNTAQPVERKKRASQELVGSTLDKLGGYGVGGPDRSLAKRLSVAGYRGPTATMRFLGLRMLLSFGPALGILVPQVSQGKPLGRSLIYAGAAWGIGHMLVNARLKSAGKKRVLRIVRALPDVLDLMVVCLESGLGLNATIARLGEERSKGDDPLGKELSHVSLELSSGRSREDALRALGDRNGVDDLKTLVGLVIQCDRLGASMGKTLRAHADMLRTKRRQRAEEAARKLPIKMLLPLGLFILPPLFTVTVGPAILQIMTLFKGVGE